MRRLVGDLFADLRRLEERIREVTQEIEAVADREDVTRRTDDNSWYRRIGCDRRTCRDR